MSAVTFAALAAGIERVNAMITAAIQSVSDSPTEDERRSFREELYPAIVDALKSLKELSDNGLVINQGDVALFPRNIYSQYLQSGPEGIVRAVIQLHSDMRVTRENNPVVDPRMSPQPELRYRGNEDVSRATSQLMHLTYGLRSLRQCLSPDELQSMEALETELTSSYVHVSVRLNAIVGEE